MEAEETLTEQATPGTDSAVETPVYTTEFDSNLDSKYWFSSDNPEPQPIYGEIINEPEDPELDRKIVDPEKPRRDVDTGIPDKDEWLDFFSRIILKVGLELYTEHAFRGVDEETVSERDLARIRVTREERDIIARPFAEYSVKNKWLRKHGREIVSLADSLESIVTLGIWVRKINRIASKYKPKKVKNSSGPIRIRPERSEATHEHNRPDEGTGSANANGFTTGPTIFNPGSG